MSRWYPVARGAELEPRHIVQTQLLGREIALWRSDAGAVNAWENRCPHRGVRLSIGYNTGNEVRCQYHGWRFAAGSGQCTFIPAHPTQKPASSIRVGVYAAVERYHLVWVNLDAQAGAAEATSPTASDLGLSRVPEGQQDMTLRGIFVNAPAEEVSGALLEGYRVDEATFVLQPVSDRRTVIHGLLPPGGFGADRLAVLRDHNRRLCRIRDAVEARSGEHDKVAGR